MWFKQTVIVEVEYLEQQHGWLMVWLLSFASLFCMFCMESNLITIHMTCRHSSIKRTWKVFDMFGTSSSTYKINCIYTRNRSMDHTDLLWRTSKSLCLLFNIYVPWYLRIHWDALPPRNTHHQHHYPFSGRSLLTFTCSTLFFAFCATLIV